MEQVAVSATYHRFLLHFVSDDNLGIEPFSYWSDMHEHFSCMIWSWAFSVLCLAQVREDQGIERWCLRLHSIMAASQLDLGEQDESHPNLKQSQLTIDTKLLSMNLGSFMCHIV